MVLEDREEDEVIADQKNRKEDLEEFIESELEHRDIDLEKLSKFENKELLLKEMFSLRSREIELFIKYFQDKDLCKKIHKKVEEKIKKFIEEEGEEI